jgi:hypothetical protein
MSSAARTASKSSATADEPLSSTRAPRPAPHGCHEAGQIKAERILGGEPGTAERTRPARVARVDQQDVAAAAQRSQQLTPVGRLLGVR